MSTQASYGRFQREGWVQWPAEPELSFQFARTLGGAQEGASLISECFAAASKMTPGDTESWHREWQALAKTSERRANDAFAQRRLRTASSNWLRAANYYRSSEFYLAHDDPRRLDTFDSVERCSHRYLAGLTPAGEIIRIPYENGAHLDAYFLPCAEKGIRSPVVIAFGGLDEYKDELLHEMPKHALTRGMSLLLVDMPGQGGTLRRQKLPNRPDTEVPVGACVDYLLTRTDVDPAKIALYGASVGGVYAARAASFEKRIVAAVSDSVMFDMSSLFESWLAAPERSIWRHLKWVFGCETIEGVVDKARAFRLEGVIDNISIPYLVLQGTEDWLGLKTATDTYDYAKAHGVDAELKLFDPAETGAAHCQIDNPTLGQEFICDWLAARLDIDQSSARVRVPALA